MLSGYGVPLIGFGFAANNAYLAKNPEVVRKFLAATKRGFAEAARDSEAACELMQAKVHLAGTVERCVDYNKGVLALSTPPTDANWGQQTERGVDQVARHAQGSGRAVRRQAACHLLHQRRRAEMSVGSTKKGASTPSSSAAATTVWSRRPISAAPACASWCSKAIPGSADRRRRWSSCRAISRPSPTRRDRSSRKIVEDLELERPRPAASCAPTRRWSIRSMAIASYVGWRDRKRVDAQLETFAPGEAARYDAFFAYLQAFADRLGISIFEPPPYASIPGAQPDAARGPGSLRAASSSATCAT